MNQHIGFTTLGNGNTSVIIMHDWLNDQTSYDLLKPYLNTALYKFIFPDLRGYGLSKNIYGTCSLEEAAQDIVILADFLKLNTFHIVGHSMSGQMAQYIPLVAPNRVKSITAICTVPACGYQMPADVLEHLEKTSKNDIISAKEIVHFMTQNKYDDWFAERKAFQWFTCSTPQARAAYLHTFAQTDVSNLVKGLEIPILVIAGEYDAAAHSIERMNQTVMQDFKNASLVCLPSGHYPMEETPVALASAISRFWENLSY